MKLWCGLREWWSALCIAVLRCWGLCAALVFLASCLAGSCSAHSPPMQSVTREQPSTECAQTPDFEQQDWSDMTELTFWELKGPSQASVVFSSLKKLKLAYGFSVSGASYPQLTEVELLYDDENMQPNGRYVRDKTTYPDIPRIKDTEKFLRTITLCPLTVLSISGTVCRRAKTLLKIFHDAPSWRKNLTHLELSNGILVAKPGQYRRVSAKFYARFFQQQFSRLTHLRIDESGLRYLAPEHPLKPGKLSKGAPVPQLQSLEALAINVVIPRSVYQALKLLPCLAHLSLGESFVAAEKLEELVQYPALTHLSLEDISLDGLNVLSAMPHLKKLQVRNVYKKCVRELCEECAKARPSNEASQGFGMDYEEWQARNLRQHRVHEECTVAEVKACLQDARSQGGFASMECLRWGGGLSSKRIVHLNAVTQEVFPSIAVE
jgi:hypothetical protein